MPAVRRVISALPTVHTFISAPAEEMQVPDVERRPSTVRDL